MFRAKPGNKITRSEICKYACEQEDTKKGEYRCGRIAFLIQVIWYENDEYRQGNDAQEIADIELAELIEANRTPKMILLEDSFQFLFQCMPTLYFLKCIIDRDAPLVTRLLLLQLLYRTSATNAYDEIEFSFMKLYTNQHAYLFFWYWRDRYWSTCPRC